MPTLTAVLYRMIIKDYTCPYDLKLKDLLEQQGFDIDKIMIVHLPLRDLKQTAIWCNS